jgi:hypothetical protein
MPLQQLKTNWVIQNECDPSASSIRCWRYSQSPTTFHATHIWLWQMYVKVRQSANGLTCNKTLANCGRNTPSHSQASAHFTPELVIACFTLWTEWCSELKDIWAKFCSCCPHVQCKCTGKNIVLPLHNFRLTQQISFQALNIKSLISILFCWPNQLKWNYWALFVRTHNKILLFLQHNTYIFLNYR